MNRQVDWRGIDFQVELLDIQQLNQRLFRDEFDVAKASFHAALHLAGRTRVLNAGSALGFGVGPLLLAAPGSSNAPTNASSCLPATSRQLTLCPGKFTTAAMLFQMFYPHTTRIEHCLFSEIMPRLQARQADFGVCIHEGRFTWEQAGLRLVEDLGSRWESTTDLPLPLGGILASRRMDDATTLRVEQVIRDSIQSALRDPGETLPTMRHYAQEFDDRVLMQHVDLYVNDWTCDLGTTGRRALQELSRRAKQIGLIRVDAPELDLFRSS